MDISLSNAIIAETAQQRDLSAPDHSNDTPGAAAESASMSDGLAASVKVTRPTVRVIASIRTVLATRPFSTNAT